MYTKCISINFLYDTTDILIVLFWATSWKIGGSSPKRGWEFSLHRRGQIGSGAHPASYPVGNRGSFLGGKAAGA
jgi:hypothetical protein